ncbi:MAG: PilC/PilY family type IV pilus protein [Thiotrichales bacterium]
MFTQRGWAQGVVLLFLMLSVAANADDTEIYLTTSGEVGQPNILFMLDTSGSMKLGPDGNPLIGTGEENNENSRYQIMKRVLTEVLAVAPDTINVGLINYGGHKEAAEANGPKYPISSLGPTVRQNILSTIESFTVDGYTPIVQSLYEAANYYTGKKVEYGNSSNVQRQPHPATYEGDVIVGPTPDPLRIECTTSPVPALGSWPWTRCQHPADYYDSCEFKTEECLEDLCPAGSYDPSSCVTKTNPAGSKEQKVCKSFDEAGSCSQYETTTVTFDEVTFRQCTATVEVCEKSDIQPDQILEINGQYKTPILQECQDNFLVVLSDGEPDDGLENESDSEVLQKLNSDYAINGCADQGDGTCGPEFTRALANEDQSPLEGEQLIKTYTVGFAVQGAGQDYLRDLANLGKSDNENGDAGFFTAANEKELKDVFQLIVEEIAVANHSLAIPSISVDPDTGLTHGNEVFIPLFRPSNLPSWRGNVKKYGFKLINGTPTVVEQSGEPIVNADGSPVASSRSFWLPEDDKPDGGDIAAGGAARLLGINRNLLVNNAADQLVPLTVDTVTGEELGLEANDTLSKNELMRFVRGLKADEDVALQAMGSILHSNPVLVTYGNRTVLFVSTNEGFLHAFDTESGEELFAFMPRALLKNAKARYDNSYGQPHIYGLDGPISIWRDAEENKLYLYVGERRGGQNYYALDITDLTNPQLAWVIRGGEGDFASLGQTWSEAIPARVEFGSKIRDVLIFGGGYDTAQDEKDVRSDDETGNALYIVDAKTGERLWWASDTGADLNLEAMRNSIPANVRVIDIDNNGISDRLYAADLGGRVFRIDLVDTENTTMTEGQKKNEVSGILLADLGGDDTANNRRFYYEPDAALINDNGNTFISLSIGSGYRAHPLLKGDADSQNALFMIRDPGVSFYLSEKNHSVVHLDDLTEVPLTGSQVETPEIVAENGWYVNLRRAGGEKALARAVTLNNVVYFTTFEPETTAAENVCSVATHQGRVYGLNVATGAPALRFIDVEEPDLKQSEVFNTMDIPSEVLLVASRYEYTPQNGDQPVQGDGVTFHVMVDKLERPIHNESFVGLTNWYWEEED